MLVAAIQMNSTKDYSDNMSEAKRWVECAVKKHARLILLPEMFACIGVSNQIELAKNYFTIDKLEKTIGQWAKQYDVYIVAGSLPFCSSVEGKVYAASFVFSPNGEIIAQYNKIHLFDVSVEDEKGQYRESETFLAGTDPVTTEIDQHKLGLSICYDIRFPELFQDYQQQGCDLITVPSAFTYKTGKMHWKTLLKARAIETQSFVIAANQCGVHQDGRRTWGHSMIISPQGEVLDEVVTNLPGVAVADLDFTEMAKIRASMPLLSHKRLIR